MLLMISFTVWLKWKRIPFSFRISMTFWTYGWWKYFRAMFPLMITSASFPASASIDANSIPTKPAPIMIVCSGSSSMSRKSVLSWRYSLPLISGITGFRPVQITILSVVNFLSATWTVCSSNMTPFPWATSRSYSSNLPSRKTDIPAILFLLNFIKSDQFTSKSPDFPTPSKLSVSALISYGASRSAFELQPLFAQVPPYKFSSTISILRPSFLKNRPPCHAAFPLPI